MASDQTQRGAILSALELTRPERLLDRDELVRICDEHRANGERIVFTNGCFDLLHVGHALYLEAARGLGDRLVVGINSDRSTRELKGLHRPLMEERARALLLLALRSVDYVSVFDELDPEHLIRAVRPHVICKGGDYRPEEIVGREFVESDGGTVTVIPYVPGFSTTELLIRIQRAIVPRIP